MLLGIIEVSVNLYLVVIALWSIDALINALHDSYEEVLAFREVAPEGDLSGGQVGGQCDRG